MYPFFINIFENVFVGGSSSFRRQLQHFLMQFDCSILLSCAVISSMNLFPVASLLTLKIFFLHFVISSYTADTIGARSSRVWLPQISKVIERCCSSLHLEQSLVKVDFLYVSLYSASIFVYLASSNCLAFSFKFSALEFCFQLLILMSCLSVNISLVVVVVVVAAAAVLPSLFCVNTAYL